MIIGVIGGIGVVLIKVFVDWLDIGFVYVFFCIGDGFKLVKVKCGYIDILNEYSIVVVV